MSYFQDGENVQMKKSDDRHKILISVISIGAVLLIWFLATNIGSIPTIILPKPQDVWNSFVTLCRDGYGTNKDTLMVHMMASMKRLLIAYGLSVITAVPIGLLCGYFPKVSSIVTPFVEFYRPIPPLAYYTLLVLWLGINEESKIMLLFLAGFAPIFISCVSGVKRISADYLNASYMLGANKRQTFMNVILPASLPDIFTGLRTAIGFEYTTLVAAEMVAAKQGIGWMVLDASNWLKSEVVFAGVIVMGLTGILLTTIVMLLEKKFVHWAGK